jgi:hypothetical protein
MPNNVEDALLEKLPAGITAGRKTAIQRTADASKAVKLNIADAATNRNRTAIGNAREVHQPYLKKAALPWLLRAKRDLAYGAKLVANGEAALRTKAAGVVKPTDGIWLDRIWALSPNERAKLVLENPAARGPALREPELAGIDSSVFEHAMRRQIQQYHEREAALLLIAKNSQEVQRLMTNELEKSILATPAVVDPNGAVRPFDNSTELARFTDAELPGQSAKPISTVEEISFDAVDEAA